MRRYIITTVNVAKIEGRKLVQVGVKIGEGRIYQVENFHLIPNAQRISSYNDMNFNSFKSILSTMTNHELVVLKKNINGYGVKEIVAMVHYELRRRFFEKSNNSNGNQR